MTRAMIGPASITRPRRALVLASLANHADTIPAARKIWFSSCPGIIGPKSNRQKNTTITTICLCALTVSRITKPPVFTVQIRERSHSMSLKRRAVIKPTDVLSPTRLELSSQERLGLITGNEIECQSQNHIYSEQQHALEPVRFTIAHDLAADAHGQYYR